MNTRILSRIILIILLIATCLMMTSCIERDFVIQPDLRSYYRDFKIEAKARGVNIEDDNLVMHYTKNLGRWGLTTTDWMGDVTIEIDSSLVNDDRLRLVIYHELGHGKLNRDHVQIFSLMNPSVPWETRDSADMVILCNELFKR